MTMGVTLGWSIMTALGFLVMTGLVVALGTSSTARYEFERNGARERQGSAARSHSNHPAGSRAPSRAPPPRARRRNRTPSRSPSVPFRPR